MTTEPVLLLDVMDTLVTDPFFEHMPRFFNMSFNMESHSPHFVKLKAPVP